MRNAFTLLITGLLALWPVLPPAEKDSDTVAVLHLLADGKQREAEFKAEELLKKEPQNPHYLFLDAVLTRSRFDVRNAAREFAWAISADPNSTEGLASACVLGIDLSQNASTSLYYFNALLILCQKKPESIPLHFITAVMTRALTRDNVPHEVGTGYYTRTWLQVCGVDQYEKTLALMAPGPGPSLVHQTMANLLDDLDGSDLAWPHRQMAMRLERTSWSVHGAAVTLLRLGRLQEALALAKDALALARREDSREYEALSCELMSLACVKLGRLSDALAASKEASVANSNPGEDLMACAMLCRDMGDYPQAYEYAREAVALTPENRVAKIWCARFAAMTGVPNAAQLLQEAGTLTFSGAPVNFGSPATEPWGAALETGDEPTVRKLIGTVDINHGEPHYMQTPLMTAACEGWEQIAVDLIKAGAELNKVDVNGDTALHYSADFRNPRLLKILLDAGARMEMEDKWKHSPLMQACLQYEPQCLSMLLEKGANPNLKGAHDGTALHMAAGGGDLLAMRELIAHGADVNLADASGATPLIIACQKFPHPYLIAPLLEAGADLNARDKQGRTALYYAIDPILNLPLAEQLLAKGADPTLVDSEGVSAAQRAYLLGYEELAHRMEHAGGRPPNTSMPQLSFTGNQKIISRVLPILFAQGHVMGGSVIFPNGNKGAARGELDRAFGIKNAGDLEAELAELKNFQPLHRDDAANLNLCFQGDKITAVLREEVEKIHGLANPGSVDERAWTQAHRIYLAELGADAGYLSAADAEERAAEAAGEIEQSFDSWPTFLKSYNLGARFHNGWEADRYEQISKHILASGLPWR